MGVILMAPGMIQAYYILITSFTHQLDEQKTFVKCANLIAAINEPV